MFLALVTFIVFLFFCCGLCDKKEGSRQPFAMLACLLFVLFIGCFIAILVFLGLVHHRHEDVLCAIYKMPGGLVDGFNDTNTKFAGLAGYKYAYGNFTTEQNNLPTVSGQINAIRVSPISSQSNAVY